MFLEDNVWGGSSSFSISWWAYWGEAEDTLPGYTLHIMSKTKHRKSIRKKNEEWEISDSELKELDEQCITREEGSYNLSYYMRCGYWGEREMM